MVAPGAVALEAAAITVPVLVAVGERDVVPDPWMEPKAFKSAHDVSVFVCPRMGHMHNFATTRSLFWQRIHSWGAGVAEMRAQLAGLRSEEHTSELQSLMRISYAVFCLTKKTIYEQTIRPTPPTYHTDNITR